MLKWPDAHAVRQAVERWMREVTTTHAGVRRVGYFGSYARGDWGVGSDIDLLVIVEDAQEPFSRRGAAWDTTSLPVPADVLVYTEAEWERLRQQSAFGRRVAEEVRWLS